jgi:hypothetical protein
MVRWDIWRFLHSVTSVGKRGESTASLGLVVPGPHQDSGVLGTLRRAPGIGGTLATGLASRSQYVWVGGGCTRFAEASNADDRGRHLGAAGQIVVVDGFFLSPARGRFPIRALQVSDGGNMTMAANSQVSAQSARRAALLNYFSLFSSFSTLICCALPSVLVLLRMGLRWRHCCRRLRTRQFVEA